MRPIRWSGKHRNKVCPYCWRRFDGVVVKSTKEHLIGRKFVPPGSFDDGRGFNFIFDACSECNVEKSRFEGHISAVTQFISPSVAATEALAFRANEKEVHPWTKRRLPSLFTERSLLTR